MDCIWPGLAGLPACGKARHNWEDSDVESNMECVLSLDSTIWVNNEFSQAVRFPRSPFLPIKPTIDIRKGAFALFGWAIVDCGFRPEGGRRCPIQMLI